jgi:uncharacterized protein involved in exopolysaccharide biosynthesis
MMGLDVKSMVVVWFKYRVRVTLVLVAALSLSTAASILMRTQYESTASVLVKIGRELVYRPEVGNTQAALPTMDKDNLIASNIAIITSNEIAAKVIAEVGLARLYPKIAGVEEISPIELWIGEKIRDVQDFLNVQRPSKETEAIRMFMRRLSVTTVKKTDIIAVTFMHPDPVIAAQVANLVVDRFQEKVGEIYSNPNLAFMQKSVTDEEAGLAKAQGDLNNYRQKFGVYSLDAQMDMLLKQKMDVDTGLKNAEAHIAELGGMIATLVDQRSHTPQSVRLFAETERHRSIDDAQTQVLNLSLQEKQLSSRYTDNYRPLIEARAQLAAARAALSSDRADSGSHSRLGINDTYQEINQETLRRQSELQSTISRRDAMAKQVATIDAATSTLSSRQRNLLGLQQDVTLRTDALKATYDKLVDARAVAGLNREKPASFSVVQAAAPADLADPSRPLPLLYTLAAIGAGLFGGVTLTFLSYRMSGTFVTAAQASHRLKLPILAEIGYDRRQVGRWNVAGPGPTGLTLGYGNQVKRSQAAA